MVILSGCDPFSHSTCKWSKVFSKEKSPDQSFVAEVWGFTCKPETDKVTMMRVEIIRLDEHGEDRFPIDSETVLQRNGKFSIKTSWLGPRHLLVECEGMPLNAEDATDLRKPPEDQEDH